MSPSRGLFNVGCMVGDMYANELPHPPRWDYPRSPEGRGPHVNEYIENSQLMPCIDRISTLGFCGRKTGPPMRSAVPDDGTALEGMRAGEGKPAGGLRRKRESACEGASRAGEGEPAMPRMAEFP